MKPILVLQMQRMGDLILSFPLLGFLQNLYPNNPIWTVAEPIFFEDLMQFAPHTTFFPPDAADKLKSVDFHSVINLSHRSESTILASSLRADHYYGARIHEDKHRIDGAWHLLRASIVHNNRYNIFHWSDLQLLEHAKKGVRPFNAALAKTPRPKTKVGIFVGASEREKRPTPEFFAKLAQILLRKGYHPIFLGGPNDVYLGQDAANLSGLKHASLCGKLSLNQLASVLLELSLFITADTGPMHLAAWLRTPILNISIGPVNPWETGPYFANHYILQPRLACVGCWQACQKTSCQKKLHAGRVALVAQSIMENPQKLSSLDLDDLCLYSSGRDVRNLYDLKPINHLEPSARLLLARFWQDWFWHRLNANSSPTSEHLNALDKVYPYLAEKLRTSCINLANEFQVHLKNVYKGKATVFDDDFWKKLPSPIRPLSGYIHMYLQNENYSRNAWVQVLHDVEILGEIIRQ